MADWSHLDAKLVQEPLELEGVQVARGVLVEAKECTRDVFIPLVNLTAEELLRRYHARDRIGASTLIDAHLGLGLGLGL